MKNFLNLFLIGFLALGPQNIQAATLKDQVSGAQTIRTDSEKNFVLNPSGHVNTLNVSTVGSGVTISRNTIASSFDASNYSIALGTTVSAGVKWTLDYAGELSGLTCEVSGSYTFVAQTGASESIRLYDGTTLLNSQTLTPGSSGTWLPISIVYPCGSSSSLSIQAINTAVGGSSSTLLVKRLKFRKWSGYGTLNVDTDWQDYTPTIVGAGTTSLGFAKWKRVGDSIIISTRFTTGTPTGVTATFSLPSGLTSSVTAQSAVGILIGQSSNPLTAVSVLAAPASSNLTFGVVGAGFSSNIGTNLFGTTALVGFTTDLIPVTGWTSAQSQTISANAMFDSTGLLVPSAATSCASGTIAADGSAVSRTNYAHLFQVIGTTYGSGDGSTTFNVPNMNAAYLRGTGSQTFGGITYSATQGTTYADMMQGHFHSSSTTSNATSGSSFTAAANAGSSGTVSVGSPVTDGTNGTPRTGSETRPFSVVAKYCIVANGVIGMPIQTGSISTNSSSIERLERANITCSSASAINSQSGSWMTSIGNVSSGKCSIVIASGMFASSGYSCTFTPSGTATTTILGVQLNNKTTTGIDIYGASISTGSSTISAATSFTGDLVCEGPR